MLGKKITYDDLVRYLRDKTDGTGHDEPRIVRICLVAMVNYFDAVDRWVRLENDRPGSVAPLWLSETDVDAMLIALRGKKGAEVRLIRQALQALHSGR